MLMGNSSHNMHLEIDDQDLPKTIAKIISNKQHCRIVLPPQKQNRKVLVLDLDETLVFSSFNKPNKYDCESEVLFNGRPTKIYTVKRFGLDSFLFEMSKLFEIVVFTASQKIYADRILNLIDPKSRISHRLYR
jgi:TFIIF-interacting CTD phosphatase-like protein